MREEKDGEEAGGTGGERMGEGGWEGGGWRGGGWREAGGGPMGGGRMGEEGGEEVGEEGPERKGGIWQTGVLRPSTQAPGEGCGRRGRVF